MADPRVLPAARIAAIAALWPRPAERRDDGYSALVSYDMAYKDLHTVLAHAEALGAALATARKHAVSAIYFDDSSDFGSALWDVVRALDPEMADLLESDERAAFEKSRALSGSPPTGETNAPAGEPTEGR